MKSLRQQAARILVSIGLVLGLFTPMMTPAFVRAQETTNEANISGSLCQGANLQVGEPGDCEAAGEEADTKVNNTIAFVINLFSVIVGVVAVIMIIWGGFKYITSGGDSGNVGGAKNTILYAIIGLVIVALSQFIVKFVLGKTSGA